MVPVDELLLLHEALLADGPRASERFLDAAGRRLRPLLRRRHAPLPTELVLDAATDALLFCVQHPERYRPASGSLLNFLVHIADNRVRDALRKIQRRKEILASDCTDVEFLTLTTNYEQNTMSEMFPTGDPNALPPELERLLCDILPDPTDRKLWELVCQGSASAADYVAVLNIAHLPPEQQKLEIKRRRDKVVARVRRHRKEFQELL